MWQIPWMYCLVDDVCPGYDICTVKNSLFSAPVVLQSKWATPPSSRPCAPRPLSSHPWQTVGYPPQSVGQYQGMCAFKGWVDSWTCPVSWPTPFLHICMSQTQGIAHMNMGLSSKEYHTVFYEDHENTEIVCAHGQFPSLSRLAHGGICCTRWE